MAKIKLYQRSPAPQYVGVPQMDNSGSIIANAVASSANLLADQANQTAANDQYMARWMLNQASQDLGQAFRQQREAEKREQAAIDSVHLDNAKYEAYKKMQDLEDESAKQPYDKIVGYYDSNFADRMTPLIEQYKDNPAVQRGLSQYITSQRLQQLERVRNTQKIKGEEQVTAQTELNVQEVENSVRAPIETVVDNEAGRVASPKSLQDGVAKLLTLRPALNQTSRGGEAGATMRIYKAAGTMLDNYIKQLIQQQPKEAVALLDAFDSPNLNVGDSLKIDGKGIHTFLDGDRRKELMGYAQSEVARQQRERIKTLERQHLKRSADNEKLFRDATVLQNDPQNESQLLSVLPALREQLDKVNTDIEKATSVEEQQYFRAEAKEIRQNIATANQWLTSIASNRKTEARETKQAAREAQVIAKEKARDTEKQAKDAHEDRYRNDPIIKALYSKRNQAAQTLKRLTAGGKIDATKMEQIQKAAKQFYAASTAITKEGMQTYTYRGNPSAFNKSVDDVIALVEHLEKFGVKNKESVLKAIVKNVQGLNKKPKALETSKNPYARTEEFQTQELQFKEEYRKIHGVDPSDLLMERWEAKKLAEMKQKLGGEF